MQENEFEKHVQERIDELKLRPSDAVWSAVEEELRKKKKRRVIFFIFLLAGLGLLGYSGYTFLDNSTINNSKNITVKQNENLPTDKKTDIKSDRLPVGVKTSSPVNEQVSAETTKENSNNTNTTIVLQKENKILKANKNIGETEIAVAKKKHTAINKNIAGEKQRVETITKTNQPKQNDDLPTQQEKPVNTLTSETGITQNDVVKENTAKGKVSEILPEKIADKDTVAAEAGISQEEKPVIQKKKTASKIKWGFELSGGISSSSTKPLSIFSMDKVADRVNAGGPQTTPGGYAAMPASSVQPGLAFKAGVLAELKLSKRSSLSSVLRYTYISEKIKVGQFDATLNISNAYSSFGVVNGAYRGARQTQHTNKYHFIEIPLTYQLQLNKGNKLPVFWNTGISAAYLVGTNALVYDTASGGIYYKQTSEFNKMHFSFNTGFSFRFGSKNKLQWSLGPDLSVDMTKLMKQNLYTKKRYLLYGGLSLRLFLPEKKK